MQIEKCREVAEKWQVQVKVRRRQTAERERNGGNTKKLSNTENWQIADRGRVDGSALLFQANFIGSNQSTAPDTDGAAAICREISPLIGPTEKATASALQLALDRFTSPHNLLYEQLDLPINRHNDRLLLTRTCTGLTASDYFMVLEQCVSWKN